MLFFSFHFTLVLNVIHSGLSEKYEPSMADQDAHWVWSKGEGKLDGVAEGDGVDGGRRH